MTWISDTELALRHLGGKARLKDIVDEVEKIRIQNNNNIGWVNLNVGLILYRNRDGNGQNIFTKIDRGVYKLKTEDPKESKAYPMPTLNDWAVEEIEQFKQEIHDETNVLEHFEKIIGSAISTENAVGQFLKKNPYIFGLHYVNASSEDKIGLNGRTDFLMEKVDGYYDVIELKGPNENIFVQEGDNHYFILSAVAKNATSQMMSYLSKYDILYLSQKEETQKDVLYPKGIIVIGKRKESERRALKIHNHFLNHIEIKTYDDILDEIKTSIENLRKMTSDEI